MTDHHILIVHEHPDDGMDVEHPPSCPQYGHDDTVYTDQGAYACEIEFHVSEAGLDSYFHRGPEPERHDTVLATPGRHPIDAWSTKSYSWEYGSWEYDGGLDLSEGSE
jgi:hypothetical protein